MQNILKIENLKKYYGTKNNITKAIDNISFSVNEGEFVAIMGASGSGKTTLLNCISTIDTVTAGKIIINGNDITEIKDRDIASFRRNNLGFVFQDFNLLDTLTIAENISQGDVAQRPPRGAGREHQRRTGRVGQEHRRAAGEKVRILCPLRTG